MIPGIFVIVLYVIPPPEVIKALGFLCLSQFRKESLEIKFVCIYNCEIKQRKKKNCGTLKVFPGI